MVLAMHVIFVLELHSSHLKYLRRTVEINKRLVAKSGKWKLGMEEKP
jgi:hypothetical protein